MELLKEDKIILLNEEFEWNRDFLKDLREEGSSSDGPVETITEEEVRTAIKQMKKGKAAGPSGVTVEMLQAAGEPGIRWVTEICNAILKEGKVPSDWERSWIVSVYKGKGDALECGSYRGIKLLDQVMKVMERVIEKRVRSIVLIDEMQFGFRPGRGTTDAIFIVRQLQEKYLGRKRELWMAFLDLEKAFDRVPREVVWWALGQMNVDRSLINVIMSMYKNARASVKVNGVGGRDFPVEVGVHQGSVLSPLLFIIVMEALSRTFSDRVSYLKDRKRSDELLGRLGIECVEKKIQRGRLRWFGHVERKNEEDWVKKCTKLNVDGMVGRGAPRKMWRKCVDEDMRSMGIKVCVAQDRCAWRNAIRGPTRASADALHLTLVV